MGVIISPYVFAALHFQRHTNDKRRAPQSLTFRLSQRCCRVGLPHFPSAKFNLSAILVMAPIALATMMEHIGDISAISATVDQNFIEDPGLHP